MIATTLPLLLNAAPSFAQQPPPDLQMLLNLDLFGKAAGTEATTGESGPDATSLLEQIRQLGVMGYLGGKAAPQASPSVPVARAPSASPTISDAETE